VCASALLFVSVNSFWYNKFYSPREPMHSLSVRNPG